MALNPKLKRSLWVLLATALVAPVVALSMYGHWQLLLGGMRDGTKAYPLHEIGAFYAGMCILVANGLLWALGRQRLRSFGSSGRILSGLFVLVTMSAVTLQNFAFQIPALFWGSMILTLVVSSGMILAPLPTEEDASGA